MDSQVDRRGSRAPALFYVRDTLREGWGEREGEEEEVVLDATRDGQRK